MLILETVLFGNTVVYRQAAILNLPTILTKEELFFIINIADDKAIVCIIIFKMVFI